MSLRKHGERVTEKPWGVDLKGGAKIYTDLKTWRSFGQISTQSHLRTTVPQR